ncbi:hypothetical protein Rhal01_02905 [Rubritalea halochordaticola]|uniref:Uncharacterized protein n=2 Tax=Rubritalea halochordaticola TaxID=714537 RepID=A0ABP9V3X2_9BACT
MPHCWIEVPLDKALNSKCLHYDLSKGQKDPSCRYVVMIECGAVGGEYYTLDYFDEDGKWFTQLAFGELDAAFTQIEFEFSLKREDWQYP